MFFVGTKYKNDGTAVYQISTSNRTYRKNAKVAPVCRIFVLQPIKLEKNGFHSLNESQISFHTIYSSYLKPCFLSESEAKITAHQFIKFRRQIERTGKNGKTAPVCRLFILHQIKLEKNGFHSLFNLKW